MHTDSVKTLPAHEIINITTTIDEMNPLAIFKYFAHVAPLYKKTLRTICQANEIRLWSDSNENVENTIPITIYAVTNALPVLYHDLV